MKLPNRSGIAELESPIVRMISIEQQICEKIHAYTLPRQSIENSRTKDLIDLYVIFKHAELLKANLPIAMKTVFERRATHSVPASLPKPPESWNRLFLQLAADAGITISMEKAFIFVSVRFEWIMK